jgi:hypothetical protein
MVYDYNADDDFTTKRGYAHGNVSTRLYWPLAKAVNDTLCFITCTVHL